MGYPTHLSSTTPQSRWLLVRGPQYGLTGVDVSGLKAEVLPERWPRRNGGAGNPEQLDSNSAIVSPLEKPNLILPSLVSA